LANQNDRESIARYRRAKDGELFVQDDIFVRALMELDGFISSKHRNIYATVEGLMLLQLRTSANREKTGSKPLKCQPYGLRSISP
jgi:hypothetical protein